MSGVKMMCSGKQISAKVDFSCETAKLFPFNSMKTQDFLASSPFHQRENSGIITEFLQQNLSCFSLLLVKKAFQKGVIEEKQRGEYVEKQRKVLRRTTHR